jgi:hypothetical protein
MAPMPTIFLLPYFAESFEICVDPMNTVTKKTPVPRLIMLSDKCKLFTQNTGKTGMHKYWAI